MNIRRLTKDDQPFLWEMLYHALYVREGDEPFPRSIVHDPEVARYAEGWGLQSDLGFAAVNEAGQSIGAVWIRLFSDEARGYGYVAPDCPELSIAILPDYRNQGFGTLLLQHMIAEARKHHSTMKDWDLRRPALMGHR